MEQRQVSRSLLDKRAWVAIGLGVPRGTILRALDLGRFQPRRRQAPDRAGELAAAARPLAAAAGIFFVIGVAVTAPSALPGAAVLTQPAGAIFGPGWGTLIALVRLQHRHRWPSGARAGCSATGCAERFGARAGHA